MTTSLRRLPTIVLLCGVLCTVAGCDAPVEQVVGLASEPSSGPLDPIILAPLDPGPRITTDPAVAVANLEARVDSLRRAHLAAPSDSTRAALTDALLATSAFLGRHSALAEAQDLVAAATTEGAELPALELQARVAGAVHRFDAALEALDAAEDLSGTTRSASKASHWLALGIHRDEALAIRRAAADGAPGFATLADLAASLADRGRFREADEAWIAAARSLRDVSPLPPAWVAFRRGVMWAEQADRPDLARPLYEVAVGRLPRYVVAGVHLAELEAAAGETERAVERLERLVPVTEDPEPAGLLAELLVDRPDLAGPGRAAALADVATASYETLLARHPRAFLDHAAELFAGNSAARSPDRAVELALENLRWRDDDRAWIVAIEAAQAADRHDLACDLAALAGEDRPNEVLARARAQACATP